MKSLRAENKYLQGPDRRRLLVVSAVTSTAIEGVHIDAEKLVAARPAAKRGRKPASAATAKLHR